MKQRNSCRVVINPIFGNENIKKMIASRGSQLERKRRMEEIVSQIEKEFDDLETLMKKTHETTPTATPTKSAVRLSLRTRLRKGDTMTATLEAHLCQLNAAQRNVVESRLSSKWINFMRSGEVSKVMSACSFDDIA